MKIIFDLDYTLLDTVRFKEALAEAVTSCGVSRENYEAAYQAIINREGKMSDYDPDVHLDALQGAFPSAEARVKARQNIDGLLLHTEKYLFPGAAELLWALRRDGNELILLTLGNEKWQRAKIDHSRLSELFDEVITTGEHKHMLLRSIVPEGGSAIIVNDNGKEMQELMAEATGCTYVLMKGPKSEIVGLGLPEVSSIKELAKYFENEGILKEPTENLPPGFGR